jgi:hypothetical protein
MILSTRQPLPHREQPQPQRQEEGGQRQDHPPRLPRGEEQVAERQEQRRRAERVEQADAAARFRRHVDELAAAQPEDEGRQEHQDARDGEGRARAQAGLLLRGKLPPAGKGPGEPGAGILLDARDQDGGEERTEVHAEVKDLEDRADARPVVLAELVADVGRDARLDAAGAEHDQRQAEVDALEAVLPQRQRGVPQAVEQRQVEDGLVLAGQAVGDDGADHRQGVDAGDEQVHRRAAQLVGPGLGGAGGRVQRHEVDEEDGLHPVEAEALAGLVADDVRDARRPAGGRVVGGRAVAARRGRARETGRLLRRLQGHALDLSWGTRETPVIVAAAAVP